MDLFGFVNWVLLAIFGTTLLWPLNVPLLMAAYKVRLGTKPIPYEDSEYWFRFIFGTLGLAGITLVTIGVEFYVIEALEMQDAQGVVHLVLLGLYLPAAIGFLFWMLAMDHPLEALGVFLIFLMIGGVPVLLVGRLLGVWKWLAANAPWLLSPSP